MNRPTGHGVSREGRTRPQLWLDLVVVAAVLTAFVTGITGDQSARADTSGTISPSCSEVNTADFTPECTPPDLLNLSGLYSATSAQATSLEDLELTATANTISDHGLAGTDGNAVLSWARPDAEAELYALIVQAINAPAASQTPDQQNTVAWVQAVEQREAEVAAQDAGLEYVKWAGLDQSAYASLISLDADQSDLQSFFAGSPPSPFGPGGSNGYCNYQPPSPDQSDYTAPSSYCAGGGGLGAIFGTPAAPSYDEFTDWGEADADYSLLDSVPTLEASADIAAGLYFAAPLLGGAIGGTLFSSGLATALTQTDIWTSISPFLARAFYERKGDAAGEEAAAEDAAEEVAEEAGDSAGEAAAETAATAADTAAAESSAQLAGGLGFVAGVLLFDITTAVVQGIDIANTNALPGQLASLIDSARTTVPAQSTLLDGANGASSLFSLFVGATLPMPTDQTCDNSSPIPPGLTVISGSITEGNPDCLNPPAIPPAASTDPQFVVQEQGGTASSTTSSITWENTSPDSTLTARLSGDWFVLQENGSDVAQTLSIPYTDWNGNQQIAFLVGTPSTGYQFVGYNVTAGTSTQFDPSTCVADGVCWGSPSIDYVGADGNDYSAEVQPPGTGAAGSIGTMTGDNPTGFPVFGNAVEGTPVEFFANTFGPLAAFNAQGEIVSPMTYTWQFQQDQCYLGCLSVAGEGPVYSAPVSSNGVYDYTFPTNGTYSVILTATEANGDQAVDTFNVEVGYVPPTLALNTGETVPVGAATNLGATITHAGTGDIENVYVDWGDGSGVDSGECGLPPLGPGGPECNPGWIAVPGAVHPTSGGKLTLGSDASDTNIALTDEHTYASAGTYYPTVTVTDQTGAVVTQTVVETVTNPAPAINTLAPLSAPTGSSPTMTITGKGFVPGSTVQWNGSPITTNYVSSTTLTAQVPAADTGSATVGTVTVANAAPGGGTSNPQVLYIVPAQSTIVAATLATSTSAGATAVASLVPPAPPEGALSAIGSGAGTVALAQFGTDPVATTPPTAVNAYFDVSVPGSSSFSSVQVADCNLAGGGVVYFYNDTTTQWTEVPGQTYSAWTGCVTFTLAAGSTPSPAQLGGTLFGVEDAPPALTLPGNQSVPYDTPLNFSVSASDPQPNPLTLSAAGLPAGLNFAPDGYATGTVTGTVSAAPGSYTVTFTASDGVSTTSQTMTIVVTPYTAPPVALSQSFSTAQGTELTEPAGTLQSGVLDPNFGASSWTVELTGTATDGTVVARPNGSFDYTPEAGFVGTDTFNYTLTDNLGYVSAPATVTVAVDAAPAPTSVTTTTATSPTTTTATSPTTTTGAPPSTTGSAPPPTSTATPPTTTSSAPPTTTTATTMIPGPTTTTSPPVRFPHSGQSYPNGAIVKFAGRDYVFAGGRAFPASASELTALEQVDHAKITSAPAGVSAPTSTAPRSGTLLTTWAINGNPTIYFAATDGDVHGFSTGHQLSSDGYDRALVVTVPSLGGLEVGSAAGAEGSAASALSTRADGAIVNSSGAFYIFVGGRAFSISSPAGLQREQKADNAEVLQGTVGEAETSAGIASGTVLSDPGKVFVTYSGALYPFKTTAQLDRDGYGGTTAVDVPSTGGLAVVSSYSGS